MSEEAAVLSEDTSASASAADSTFWDPLLLSWAAAAVSAADVSAISDSEAFVSADVSAAVVSFTEEAAFVSAVSAIAATTVVSFAFSTAVSLSFVVS